jgi:membrane-bound lytic murein transglycosylase D
VPSANYNNMVEWRNMNDHKDIYINMLCRLFVVLFSLFLLLPCGSRALYADSSPQSLKEQPTQQQTEAVKEKEADKGKPGPIPARAAAKQPDDLWERIRHDLSWQTMQSPQVDSARKEFLRQPNYLPDVSNRADYYLYYIVEEVKKRNMPMEIALIPMVESSLNPLASGPSGAAGLWQIMPATGIHLGLERNSGYDGRKDLQESTTVALDYLETLHEEFGGDWLLALAAYNSGAGNVTRAREANEAKGLDTDFWSLQLPGHTREYVPKVIALAQIVADPDRFGVDIPSVENAPAFEVADTEKPLELAEAAKLAGVDIDILRALNPGQLGKTIAPGQSGEILLPVGTRNRFEYNIAQLTPEEIVQWQTYRIKTGDNLGDIARRFDTDVAVLQEVNGIRGSGIRAGDTLKIPGDGNAEPAQKPASEKAATAQEYRVCKGDTLSRIARKFNVSVNDIIAWNALAPGAYLHPGQQLTIYGTGG